MAKKENISYSLVEMKDKYIGKTGTPERDEYEYELRMDNLVHLLVFKNHKFQNLKAVQTVQPLTRF